MRDFNYKGYRLNIEEEWADQDTKRYLHHNVYRDGKQVGFVDWSSWGDAITEDDFKLWIDLGMPTRKHPAIRPKNNWFYPLDSEKLKKIKHLERLFTDYENLV